MSDLRKLFQLCGRAESQSQMNLTRLATMILTRVRKAQCLHMSQHPTGKQRRLYSDCRSHIYVQGGKRKSRGYVVLLRANVYVRKVYVYNFVYFMLFQQVAKTFGYVW